MIDRLRPYPEMKQTELPWLGEVPVHWDVRRNGRLFGARREIGFPDLPVLEVSIGRGVRIRDFDGGGRKQEMADRSKYQRAVRGDIAYNMMRMWQGAVGIAPADGLVSPAYVVARPFPETDAAYYAYLFRTAAYMRETDVFSRGIVPDRNRLYWESFKQMPSVYPPIDEQRLIVRYLNWHGAQTAKLILAKKKLIALLSEQKQALIHRAVTRGFEPNAKTKPTGISWLGDVPSHWELKKIKHCLRAPLAYGVLKPDKYSGPDPVPLVRILDIEDGMIKLGQLEQISPAQDREFARTRISAGDVLISVVGTIGRTAVVPDSIGPMNLSRAVCRVQPVPSLVSEFLHFSCLSRAFLDQADRIPAGTAQKVLNLGDLKQFDICLPSVSEQKSIVASLTSLIRPFATASCLIRDEISLIQSLRAGLIAEVVTGKLDVRPVAAVLPEIAQVETADVSPDDDVAEEDFDQDEAQELAA